MQGRISKMRNSRIQSFPWEVWKEEFICGSKVGFSIMEWTIDSDKFEENPLVTLSGKNDILNLISKFNIKIPSITCDYFMENPPWKANLIQVEENIVSILNSMSNIDSQILVMPLVDNSSIIDFKSYKTAKLFFNNLTPVLKKNNVRIAFESDFNPEKLFEFINEFDINYFGINYDIGNSSSLGFNPTDEFKAYGSRIINVHVKDRKLNGTTVPLGEGDADFLRIFRLLHEENYQGNLILQTARSKEGKDTEVLVEYKKLVEDWWEEASIA